MTNKTIQFFQFDENEFKEVCTRAEGFYIVQTDLPGHRRGAVVQFDYPNASEMLEGYYELRKKGYKRSAVQPQVYNGNLGAGIAPSYTLYVEKSDKQQQADLEAIYAEIRVGMEAELEIKNQRETERQLALLVEAEERKQQKAEQDRQAALRAEKLKELEAAYAPKGSK